MLQFAGMTGFWGMQAVCQNKAKFMLPNSIEISRSINRTIGRLWQLLVAKDGIMKHEGLLFLPKYHPLLLETASQRRRRSAILQSLSKGNHLAVMSSKKGDMATAHAELFLR